MKKVGKWKEACPALESLLTNLGKQPLKWGLHWQIVGRSQKGLLMQTRPQHSRICPSSDWKSIRRST
jgi:hypothetical protein